MLGGLTTKTIGDKAKSEVLWNLLVTMRRNMGRCISLWHKLFVVSMQMAAQAHVIASLCRVLEGVPVDSLSQDQFVVKSMNMKIIEFSEVSQWRPRSIVNTQAMPCA